MTYPSATSTIIDPGLRHWVDNYMDQVSKIQVTQPVSVVGSGTPKDNMVNAGLEADNNTVPGAMSPIDVAHAMLSNNNIPKYEPLQNDANVSDRNWLEKAIDFISSGVEGVWGGVAQATENRGADLTGGLAGSSSLYGKKNVIENLTQGPTIHNPMDKDTGVIRAGLQQAGGTITGDRPFVMPTEALGVMPQTEGEGFGKKAGRFALDMFGLVAGDPLNAVIPVGAVAAGKALSKTKTAGGLLKDAKAAEAADAATKANPIPVADQVHPAMPPQATQKHFAESQIEIAQATGDTISDKVLSAANMSPSEMFAGVKAATPGVTGTTSAEHLDALRQAHNVGDTVSTADLAGHNVDDLIAAGHISPPHPVSRKFTVMPRLYEEQHDVIRQQIEELTQRTKDLKTTAKEQRAAGKTGIGAQSEMARVQKQLKDLRSQLPDTAKLLENQRLLSESEAAQKFPSAADAAAGATTPISNVSKPVAGVADNSARISKLEKDRDFQFKRAQSAKAAGKDVEYNAAMTRANKIQGFIDRSNANAAKAGKPVVERIIDEAANVESATATTRAAQAAVVAGDVSRPAAKAAETVSKAGYKLPGRTAEGRVHLPNPNTSAGKKLNEYHVAHSMYQYTLEALKGTSSGAVGTDRVLQARNALDARLAEWEAHAEMNGWIPNIKAGPGSYPRQIWASDVLKVADRYEKNPFYHIAEHAGKAKSQPITTGAMMAGAAKAMGLSVNAANPVEEISAVMRAANRTSNFTDAASVKSFAEAMWNGREDLLAAETANKTRILNKDLKDIGDIHAATLDDLRKAARSSRADSIKATADIGSRVEKAADAVGATTNAAHAAAASVSQAAVEAGIDQLAVQAARTNIRIAEDSLKANRGKFSPELQTKINDRLRAQGKASDDYVDKVTAALDDAVIKGQYADPVDMSIKSDIRFRTRVARTLVMWMAPYIDQDLMRLGPRYIWRAKGRNPINDFMDQADHTLANIQKSFTPDVINQAFSNIQNGVRAVGDNAMLNSAIQQMRPIVDILHDTSLKNPALGGLANHGVDIEAINDHLRFFGMPAHMVFDANKIPKNLTAKGANEALLKQWTEHKPVDAIGYLRTSLSAHASIAGKKAFGLAMESEWGSKVAKPGWRRITTSNAPAASIVKFVDKSMYFPPEVFDWLSRMERTALKPTRMPSSSKFGNFVNETWDPVTNLLKSTQTIARPGFILNTARGEMMANWLDNVFNPRAWKATKTMRAGGALKRSEGLLTGEELQQLDQTMWREAASGQAEKAISRPVLATGKTLEMSHNDVWRMALQNGLVQRWHVADAVGRDLTSGEFVDRYATAVGRGAHKVSKMKYMRVMGNASEKTSMAARISHMMGLLSDPKWTSKFRNEQELGLHTAARVMRFHPDPGSLTNFEGKYMRRIFPFYSWQRSIFPVVIGSMMFKPQLATLPLKGTMAANEAMGNNPESMGSQWNAGSVMPDFVRSNLAGPVFGGMTGDTGSPIESVMGSNALGSDANPLTAMETMAAGAVSPFIRAPIELGSGGKRLSSIVTGKDQGGIGDTSEYIDQMIPGSNITKLTGYSLSGTLGSLSPDPLRAIAEGQKNQFLNANFMNFMLGLRLTDPNTPTMAKIGSKQTWGGG